MDGTVLEPYSYSPYNNPQSKHRCQWSLMNNDTATGVVTLLSHVIIIIKTYSAFRLYSARATGCPGSPPPPMIFLLPSAFKLMHAFLLFPVLGVQRNVSLILFCRTNFVHCYYFVINQNDNVMFCFDCVDNGKIS